MVSIQNLRIILNLPAIPPNNPLPTCWKKKILDGFYFFKISDVLFSLFNFKRISRKDL